MTIVGSNRGTSLPAHGLVLTCTDFAVPSTALWCPIAGVPQANSLTSFLGLESTKVRGRRRLWCFKDGTAGTLRSAPVLNGHIVFIPYKCICGTDNLFYTLRGFSMDLLV